MGRRAKKPQQTGIARQIEFSKIRIKGEDRQIQPVSALKIKREWERGLRRYIL